MKVKNFSLKLFITLQATLNVFAFKKKGRRELRPSLGRMIHLQKTDAHINYDTKYEMIHNFFVIRFKKTLHPFWVYFFVNKSVGIGGVHYI